MIGETVGQYRVDGKLGAGGMGVVYRAVDTVLERPVAIKFLGEEDDDAKAQSRLLREARSASALNHPNICTVHGVGRHQNRPYMVMELVDGGPLKDLIPRDGMTADAARGYGLQIAGALAHAHEKGLVHRDLKSTNVMISADGRAKVLDFGLATRQEDAGSEDATETEDTMFSAGTIAGTLPYMAPELLRASPATPQSDVWALGVILQELATGRRPFEGQGSALMAAILQDPPAQMPEHIPATFRSVVHRCLNKDPAGRYRSATELEVALETGTAEPSEVGASIAVLPFVDLSQQRDQDYFCEGMADELIGALTRVPGLRVVSRTSSFQFKDQSLDLSTIGARLNVGAILEGSVRTAGTRLRVNTQLVSVSNGYHLWSDRYDRDMEDVFAVQDEIARAIVGELQGKLVEPDSEPIVRQPTDNLQAYHLFLQARYFWDRRFEGFLQRAIACFREAITKDPKFAHAYAGLADGLATIAGSGMADTWAEARAAAEQAVALDDTVAEAHRALGTIRLFVDWDWVGAEREYRRSLELDPSSGLCHAQYGLYLGYAGRIDDAAAEVREALALDPVSLVVGYWAATAALSTRQYDAGVQHSRRVLELDPNFPYALWTHAWLVIALGRPDEAVEHAERGAARSRRLPMFLSPLACAYAAAGRTEDARQVLAEMQERAVSEFVSPFLTALVHAALGDDADVIACLERAHDQHEWILVPFLNSHALLDPYRGDPQFQKMIKSVGFDTARV